MKGTLLPHKLYGSGKYPPKRLEKLNNFQKDMRENSLFNKLDYDTAVEFIHRMEIGCYEKALTMAKKNGVLESWDSPPFNQLYNNACYIVIQNLTMDDSFMKRVVDGDFDPRALAGLDPHEMRPDLYDAIKEEHEIRGLAKPTYKPGSFYFCHNCKKSETRSENLYSSCLDEAVNRLVTCLNCGKSWKA